MGNLITELQSTLKNQMEILEPKNANPKLKIQKTFKHQIRRSKTELVYSPTSVEDSKNEHLENMMKTA